MQAWPETLESLVAGSRAFFQRNWQQLLRVRERIRFREEALHLLLAGGVGIIGGMVNLAFFAASNLIQRLTFGSAPPFMELSWVIPRWVLLASPALGGLAAGLVIYWGLHFVGKQGTSNLLEVVVAGDGRLPFRTAVVKAVSSLLSINSGASIGREGSITQLTATLASKWGQLALWQPYRLRLLVACGAASGMAAAYNTPIAASVFAAQIVLGNFSMNLFAPLVFASVVATMISRTSMDPLYEVAPFTFTNVLQLPWFVLLGLFCGIVGAMFLKLIRGSERLFNTLPWPLHIRMFIGGILVGLIVLAYPDVWGNGYLTTTRILSDSFPQTLLFALFLAKTLGILITVGSGAVGGVFTPTLFIGAAFGSLFGVLLHESGWAGALPTSAFALVGMGSLLAATTHSALLAIIMILEISLNYSLMPPLMLACVVAILAARQFHPDTIYTQPLKEKGLSADRETAQIGAATQQTVGDIMRAPVPPLRETTTLPDIADRFLKSSHNFLPVVDAQQRLVGVIALQDLKEHLNPEQGFNVIIAYDVMRSPPPCLTPNQRLLEVLPILLNSELRNVPVVNSAKEFRLVGVVVRAEALGMLSEAIAARSTSGS